MTSANAQNERVKASPAFATRIRGALHRPRVRLGAAIAIALAAAGIAWAIIGSGDSSPSQAHARAPAAGTGPVGLSAKGLRTLSATLDSPIYWAGGRSGHTYELTQTSSAKIYVRYLPSGVKVGDKRGIFLIVATYPFPNAFKALQGVARGQGIKLPGGGLAVAQQKYPRSVHVAFPGVDYQIEVYDPSPRRSLQVAASGDIAPVL